MVIPFLTIRRIQILEMRDSHGRLGEPHDSLPLREPVEAHACPSAIEPVSARAALVILR
jgi:hypothetical protein